MRFAQMLGVGGSMAISVQAQNMPARARQSVVSAHPFCAAAFWRYYGEGRPLDGWAFGIKAGVTRVSAEMMPWP